MKLLDWNIVCWHITLDQLGFPFLRSQAAVERQCVHQPPHSPILISKSECDDVCGVIWLIIPGIHRATGRWKNPRKVTDTKSGRKLLRIVCLNNFMSEFLQYQGTTSTSDTIIFYSPIFGTQTNNIQKVKKRPVDCSPNNVTHTQPFNGPFFRDYPVSRYQKGKTNLDFTEAKDSEWQYASLHLAPDRQPCQHPTTQFFTGRMPFLPPSQQCQCT